MFGYIRTDTPQLRVREDRTFRATYCGLCRSMGKCTGCLSRLTLSYDFVFLVFVRLLATGQRPEFERRRCPLHLWRRETVMRDNDALRHCARCAALLNWHKAGDDVADERGLRRLFARAVRFMLRPGYRRAVRALPELDGMLRQSLSSLSTLERQGVASADLPASAFGELTRHIAAYGMTGDPVRIAGEIGYRLGRWVYLTDALDDRQEDARLGRFNPLLDWLGAGSLTDGQKETLEALLTQELMGIEQGLSLLDGTCFPDGMAILNNILYAGMPRVGKLVLDGKWQAARRGKET